MGKAGSIGRLARRKEFLISFWGTFLAVIALPSAVLTILGKHFSIALASCLILAAFLLSGILNRHKWRKRHLPVEDIVPDDIEKIGRTKLRCPCDLKLADEAKRLAQYWYPTDTISPDRFEQFRIKNPYILVCLTGIRGNLLGYFDIIPLKKSFAQHYLRGTITESDITHEDVLAAHEMGSCTHLFISGLAVWNPDSYADRRNANILVWGLLKYLDHFYSSAKPLVFASAATREGEDLLQKFGLEVGSEAAGRLDKRTMYMISLSREVIAKRLACLPDFSLLCSLDWLPREASSLKEIQRNRGASLPRRKAYSVPSSAPSIRRRS